MKGQAALAMWWDMAPAMRAEFEHWHSHEHFAERLALPGFLRASRWADAAGGEGFFILYELARHDALSSPEYMARLNAPTPWSRQLMPHHRNMVRCQCRVVESAGAVVAGHALTVRLWVGQGAGAALPSALGALVRDLPGREGLAGAHLLCTDAPEVPQTEEQRIRGNADGVADWIFIACGYDPEALAPLRAELAQVAERCGLARPPEAGVYQLRLCAEANAP